MNTNPLFPTDDEHPDHNSFLLHREGKHVEPASSGMAAGTNEALNFIRNKIERIYAEEPDARTAAQDPATAEPHSWNSQGAPAGQTAAGKSKHQQFMAELSGSGRGLAEIQTAWHNYYVNLPDEEKFQVWREFYEANGASRPAPSIVATPRRTTTQWPPHTVRTPMPASAAPEKPAVFTSPSPNIPADTRTLKQIQHIIRNKVTAGGKLKAKHHLQSLGFGLAVGMVTLVIFLFGFFNEVIIAPFIQPGRAEGATPIIIGTEAVAASAGPEIIIPKINLEIPIDFTQTSTDESVIENALEGGIVHYPTTAMPGQKGNSAFFGHSSNNIFNPGKYKFAFVLLHELVPGDTFYITYNGKTYIYKVFSRQIVPPTAVGVLGTVPGHAATATLITCDPPGTSINRLVVVGDQISPDASGNVASTPLAAAATPAPQLPGNGPSLWSRIWNSIF